MPDTLRELKIDAALATEGWMDLGDLIWLARRASESFSIVEVGSWMGRSTIALADNTDGIVTAVDHFLGSAEHGVEEHNARDPDWLYRTFKYNIGSRDIRVYRMSSLDAAGLFAMKRATFDMVFIDASHDRESVRSDILAWKPLVSVGGLLCGHDAGHPPIMEALAEVLPDRPPNEGSMWLWRNR